MRSLKSARLFIGLLLAVLLGGIASANDNFHELYLGSWIPDKGQVFWDHEVLGDGNHRHVIWHYFYWNTVDDMALLRDDGNEALEMDVVFNNVGGGPAWSYNYLGVTKGTHWDSNQPTAYRDTNVDDGSSYRSFTVGAPFADQLQPATWYYWWAALDHNSDGSRLGVQAQHSYRNSDCIFGYQICVVGDHFVTVIWYQDGNPDEFRIPRQLECRYVYPRYGVTDPCAAW